MLKNEIFKKGILQTPEDLEIDILLYAAEKMKSPEENKEWENYLNWLPFVEIILLVRDWLEGYKIRIRPLVKV